MSISSRTKLRDNKMNSDFLISYALLRIVICKKSVKAPQKVLDI